MTLITSPEQLPPPECELGYPTSQLRRVFDRHQFNRLRDWMRGQTVALCEGRRYNHEAGEYEEAEDGKKHGMIVYTHDVHRFIRAGQIID